MELRDTHCGWSFTFQNCGVQLILIDFRLGLSMSDGADELRLEIGSQCHLSQSGTDIVLFPEETPSVAPVLSLFKAIVLGIEIQRGGKLTINFDGDRYLFVEPDSKYEALELGCPSVNQLFVCQPGGGVSQFAGKDAR